MLTVKLVNGAGTKIVEGETVDVSPNGGGAREVTVTGADGQSKKYAVGGPDGFTVAYVENSAGQTTHVVRAR